MTSLVPAAAGLATVLGVLTSLLSPAAPTGPAAQADWADPSTTPRVASVLVVSVDGLNPRALRRLGRSRAPHLHRLVDESAGTLNARTQVEMTLTLPNHTGMVTGRRISRDLGGHGVTWNDDRRTPSTVQRAAGERVGSVFSTVADHGGSTALFASKKKFSLWTRSWSDDLDLVVIDGDNRSLVRSLVSDVRSRDRAFRFLHLSAPDVAGHAHGFMREAYLRAVRSTDRLLGRVLAAVERGPAGAAAVPTAVVLTADHGGTPGKGHAEHARAANYRVPFLVRAPGVSAGADLYDLNDDYADPGHGRPAYDDARQPIRNGMVANVSLGLLGLPPVPGSQLGVTPLDLVAP
ncbi:alkaline phosphatase family protein [Nocardioides solisilvae]|uniref:alkaline phosphatase family protein n=1 Tax=Nocardioides solisilvae TaxID=1542435 RepID=UPI0013A5AE0E|nr:alkaline phosphatase family protein [Nocardioides solisilvae]